MCLQLSACIVIFKVRFIKLTSQINYSLSPSSGGIDLFLYLIEVFIIVII
ncbi:hypothetical protein GLYMA_10G207000v4 [Glycine max]|uniref:Uncharacterized protein n=1 Tax=Glycine max TaxID=3847 RepID=K7LKK3_SOYBN|nr:hypothetical protein GYH30_028627 [Glycine max]KRH34797.1 hypothetical protein GLYMA_10G207000v4 [Glycine max]